MAAQGAHITSTTADLGEAPSIFEVLAQESLIQSMKPALQHLLRIIAERNPAKYGRLYAHADEVYLILHAVLESYYLKHYSSSFAENFYGMKRVVPPKSSDNGDDAMDDIPDSATDMESENPAGDAEASTLYNTLPRLVRHRSLLFLVLIPYLKNKCDAYYEYLLSQQQMGNLGDSSSMKKTLCKAYLGVYPIFHMLWENTMLACQLAYIFGKARYHTPLLKWAGIVLENLGEDDYNSGPKTLPFTFQDKSWQEAVSMVASRLFTGVAVTLSSGLSVGVFFLQFLEWWYSSDQKAVGLTALPNPPAPQAIVHASVPSLHTICPLCQRVRTNDTVLAVSGFVFCYSCVTKYVAANKCCPVTKYPANMDHLIRLYLPDN